MSVLPDRISNLWCQTVKFWAFSLVKREQYQQIRRNTRWKNRYRGKRCFILGNGPSLKDVRFSDLQEEYVFTVNQLMRREDFKDLHANFHLWSDFRFFDVDPDDEGDQELLRVMRSLNTEGNQPECFIPADFIDFAKKYGLMDSLRMNFFKVNLAFYEHFQEPIDFAKYLPSQASVVVYAIMLAIYMGFEEIYLLGCDTTGIVVFVKSILQANDSADYAYQLSNAEKARMTKMAENATMEGNARSYWELLRSYRILYEYCSKRGITLVNCSSSTVIGSIPRAKLSDVLAQKNPDSH